MVPLGSPAQADLNIDYSSPFLSSYAAKRISMDFQDAPLVDVLKIFSQQTDLNLVTSEDIAKTKVTVYLDDVPIDQALEQILRANKLTYEIQPESNIYIVKKITQPESEVVTRVYPLKHATVTSAKISNTLSISGSEGSGGETITVGGEKEELGIVAAVKAILSPDGKLIEDPRTNSLIITDYANNFKNIEQTIARLDVSTPQVLIEVEMLEVSKGMTDKIGVKYGQTPLTFSGGSRSHIYPFEQNKQLSQGDFTFDDQFSVGTIDASGMTAAVEFLKTQSDTKNLARPRILTLNNEPAQIKISTDEAIGVSTNTSSTGNLATQSLEAERVETGVFLTVTPQANIESGEITLAILPKVIIARTGATFSGTTFKDPEERGSQSILRVHSGDTIILGGLMRDDKTTTVTKIPLLGDIPFIGKAFRHTDTTSTERELVIFITPHIVDDTMLTKMRKGSKEETPLLVREQDIPSPRLSEVNKELSHFEKVRLSLEDGKKSK